MRRTGFVLASMLILLPSVSHSQQVVRGRIVVAQGGRTSAAASAVVQVNCGGNDASASTNSTGDYRVQAPGTGQCTIQVSYGGRNSNRLSVHIPPQGLSANWQLQPLSGGWILSRLS